MLAEIRYPNSRPEQDAGLDSANAAALARIAQTPTTGSGHPYGGANTSDWAQHGRVLYVHAGGIDQPLGLIRMDYSHDFPNPTLVVPHANWRGTYEVGTFIAANCKSVWLPSYEVEQQDSTGHRVLPLADPNGSEYDLMQERCIQIDFPGKALGMRHLLRRSSVAGPIAWMGSLPQDAQDASGLMYRRNRFYDPRSGRFTQEDPLGLAGGVNSYGFAEGDPVSYRDALGLSPADTVFYDTPELQKEVAEAATRSPEIAATLDLLNHNRHVTVQVRNATPSSLGNENPGRTIAIYLPNGDVNIEVLFDFTRVEVMNAIPRYRDNGGTTREAVVGHEFVAHALPFSMGWRCLDDGCAQDRENSLVRPDLGLPPRTF